MEECNRVEDAEEGEISDSASVEEISEDAFNRQDPPTTSTTSKIKIASNENQNQNSTTATRVWTMRDVYKYPISRDYARGLYNLAWAQAVQNKPLDELFVMTSDNSNQCANGESKVIIDVDVDDDAKEEGELEEGEIDLDSADLVVNFGKEANFIREQLQSVTLDETHKSFSMVCSKLQTSLLALGELALSQDKNDILIQLFMTALRTINSVFYSMNDHQKQQNTDILSRLLFNAKTQLPALLSSEQLKELDALILSINHSLVSSNTQDNDTVNGINVVQLLDMKDSHKSSENANQDFTSVNKYDLGDVSIKSSGLKEQSVSSESVKPGLDNSKAKGLSFPLLDLHKDHDEDTLPSPTRQIGPQFPATQTHGMVKLDLPIFPASLDKGNSLLHPYETDALKAVSSYQQKFGRSSLFVSENLPSPTPSEEDDSGKGDTGGEVTSFDVVHNASHLNESSMGQPILSSVPQTNILDGQGLGTTRTADPLSFLPNPSLRSSTAKSRDPRLRLATSDTVAQNTILPIPDIDLKLEASLEMIVSKKQKTVDLSAFDAPLPKRQRSEQTDSIIVSDVRPSIGNGGWLEDRGTAELPITSSNCATYNSDNDIRKLEQVTATIATIPSVIVNAAENFPVTGISTSTTLHSLLKDIAINPSIWMNIIKTEQQKSADASRTNTAQASSSKSILGAVPSTVAVAPRSSAIGQRSVGILQTPTHTASADEVAIVRMKPRDPRRVLHSTAVLKGGSVGLDQCKTGVAGTHATISNLSFQSQEDQLDRKSAVTLSTTPPDIACQFTKNLKNIADMISVSPSTSPSVASQTQTLCIQAYQSRSEVKGAVSEPSEWVNDAGLASEKGSPGSLQPQISWGDVEHLFEGYSDQQRADIQRERTRRLEEQKKMFSVRKLCLVLDLDHTLLNSAKFVEIDPVHEEILRKKEEQDREKPYRHLFRFPHMGMWTKLRPGIWNFLEKASNLFELHLYTMGNKLYATEMAKLLDPKGDLFAGRVISRGDDGDPFDGDERVPKSKDLEGVLGMESAVVIIDDSVRVWPHNKLNLIVVERYIYFPCSRRQFGLPGPSLLEIDHDERPEDGTLASCLGVIQRIHQNFFTHRSIDEADVRNILATEQKKILAGCRIVFSRVFPVGEASPHLHPLWQTAEQFGAVCTSQIDDQVTHVVANSLGTDKVNWALSTGRSVVHPGWVEASALLYRRANEHDFAIKS
ncbi:RNA polymerase II C-terminal domain phosphatase-like 3 [Solanum lycopersicum]|uniref:RNA polymerase II C-terminal domain phosphatase-like 3 n=1 Tax=Solanum lycopersicum TaxID=4081 RepID=UPI0002BCB3C5|nr:RNA polymerase II C-terminal domain phosphatase-like 3 [Solanum lycopersicum]